MLYEYILFSETLFVNLIQFIIFIHINPLVNINILIKGPFLIFS